MMGLVMTAINPLFAESMVPAMVIFALLASTILGLPNPLVEARDAGIYRSDKINGVPAPSMLIGRMMMPLDVLPAAVQPFSHLLPTAHAMQLYAAWAYNQPTLFNPIVSAGVVRDPKKRNAYHAF